MTCPGESQQDRTLDLRTMHFLKVTPVTRVLSRTLTTGPQTPTSHTALFYWPYVKGENRTGYIIWGAQCKMNMPDSLFKIKTSKTATEEHYCIIKPSKHGVPCTYH